jgi:hypothetical protein
MQKMAEDEERKMNGKPIMAYLAYKFSGNPTENTKMARQMALKLMKIHPDWFVIVPHFAVDGMLDGTVNWNDKTSNFTRWRRNRAGMMSVAFLSNADILVLGCEPTYKQSSGVTWEHIITQVLNLSYRRDNPIKIIKYEVAVKKTENK